MGQRRRITKQREVQATREELARLDQAGVPTMDQLEAQQGQLERMMAEINADFTELGLGFDADRVD